MCGNAQAEVNRGILRVVAEPAILDRFSCDPGSEKKKINKSS
jgi:hypothetical protein